MTNTASNTTAGDVLDQGSRDDGMQGEWGTSREEHQVDWSPCTRSDPEEQKDSPSHTPPLLSAHKYTATTLWLALK